MAGLIRFVLAVVTVCALSATAVATGHDAGAEAGGTSTSPVAPSDGHWCC